MPLVRFKSDLYLTLGEGGIRISRVWGSWTTWRIGFFKKEAKRSQIRSCQQSQDERRELVLSRGSQHGAP